MKDYFEVQLQYYKDKNVLDEHITLVYIISTKGGRSLEMKMVKLTDFNDDDFNGLELQEYDTSNKIPVFKQINN